MAELRRAAEDGDVAGVTKELANGEDVNAADGAVRRFPLFFLLFPLPSFNRWLGVVAVTGVAMDPVLTLGHQLATDVPVRMQEERKAKIIAPLPFHFF